MPCDYSKYPANWKSHIVPAIRERSGDKCEWCGVANYAMRDGEQRRYPVVLTVAHLDHDLGGCAAGGGGRVEARARARRDQIGAGLGDRVSVRFDTDVAALPGFARASAGTGGGQSLIMAMVVMAGVCVALLAALAWGAAAMSGRVEREMEYRALMRSYGKGLRGDGERMAGDWRRVGDDLRAAQQQIDDEMGK
jgi:hypothetical protein